MNTEQCFKFSFSLVMPRNKNYQRVALGFDEKQYKGERPLNILKNKVVEIINNNN